MKSKLLLTLALWSATLSAADPATGRISVRLKFMAWDDALLGCGIRTSGKVVPVGILLDYLSNEVVYEGPARLEIVRITANEPPQAAPGNLLQSDLLQALGYAIATRSDTFTLRCYGEASQDNGEVGSAWVEAVVQRETDYIDATNPPEATSGLTGVNAILGRRFKVISLRTLNADEI